MENSETAVVGIESLGKVLGRMRCELGHVFGRAVINGVTVDLWRPSSEKWGSVAIVLGRDKGMNKIDSLAAEWN